MASALVARLCRGPSRRNLASIANPAVRSFSSNRAEKATIEDLASTLDLKGTRVLMRADFNVPISKDTGAISDDTRIQAALPTINFLRDQGARVVLCSHMGRPKGQVVESLRLNPVADRLSQLLSAPVLKTDDCVGDSVQTALKDMGDGEVALLENLRFHPEETANDASFAASLVGCSGASVYVNEAFGAAHRAHASTQAVTANVDHSVAGYLMQKELQYLYGAVDAPARPMVAIVGGAKVSSKITVLESLLQKVDKVIIGGGMMFTFYRAQGLSTGSSVVEEEHIETAEKVLRMAQDVGVDVILPSDVTIASEFSADAESQIVDATQIPEGWMGLDIGPNSLDLFKTQLSDAATIVWNGPMGVFEFPRFASGTLGLAHALADRTDAGAVTIVGGGDSVAAVVKSGLSQRMSHISTGGGASLELLEGKALPGVESLDDK